MGTHRSEFTYDGQQRRVRIVEKENGATQTDTKVLWCDRQICEERAADGTTVTRRAFARGEQIGGIAHFFAADHLGSVTEISDGSTTLLGRYAFDPWGRRTVVAGSDVTSVGFTGHPRHGATGVALTLYRAYEPEFGRWVSQDPVGLEGGINLYAYVLNRPNLLIDEFGLAPECMVWCQRLVLGLPLYWCNGGGTLTSGCSCPEGSGFFWIEGGNFVLPTYVPCSKFKCNQA